MPDRLEVGAEKDSSEMTLHVLARAGGRVGRKSGFMSPRGHRLGVGTRGVKEGPGDVSLRVVSIETALEPS